MPRTSHVSAGKGDQTPRRKHPLVGSRGRERQIRRPAQSTLKKTEMPKPGPTKTKPSSPVVPDKVRDDLIRSVKKIRARNAHPPDNKKPKKQRRS